MAQSGLELSDIGVHGRNIKEGDKNSRETDPKRAVGSEGKGAKSISTCKFPHASRELRQSTICKGYIMLITCALEVGVCTQSDDDVRNRDTTRMNID